MPPSPLSLALAVQAKATRLAAATVMPPASRTVLRLVLRLSRVIGPTAGPGRPVADAHYDHDERLRMPASGDQRVGWWTGSRPVGGRCRRFHRLGCASRLTCGSSPLRSH